MVGDLGQIPSEYRSGSTVVLPMLHRWQPEQGRKRTCSNTVVERDDDSKNSHPALKICAQPCADDRNRAAVAVISRVGNELIIEGDPPGENGQAVIHLENFLSARIGQLAVADQDAQAAGIEKRLMHT